ncbi:MAG: hypothetical protein NTW19_06755 [Planctomycetota bacterium]|nr:hypothetical protein [Planctomycetota bacterium]
MTRTTRSSILAVAMATLFLAAAAPRAEAKGFPEPAPFPITWEFEFTHVKPLPIAVKGEDGHYHWYWFMSYKVVNRTGEDRLFIPDVVVTSDRGDIVTANKNLPANVYVAVKTRIGNSLIQTPNQTVGPLLQGEDYAKESVIIWPDFGHDVDHLNIMIAGLSGEWIAFDPSAPDPVAAPEPKAAPAPAAAETQPAAEGESSDAAPAETKPAPAPKPASKPAPMAKPAPAAPAKPSATAMIFRKTLMISYDLPGTNAPILETVLLSKGETWIMR